MATVVTTNPDPTHNVRELVEANSRRLDEQLASFSRRLDELRYAESKRIDELRLAESKRLDERLQLKTEYDERLLNAEAKRIDAIRAVDVNAVAVASERASDQATVLASQVAQSAEALRTLVQTTANTAQTAQQQLFGGLSSRITTLEQAQYEGKGKQAYQDPVMAELVAEMKRSRDSFSSSAGTRAGSSAVIAYAVTAISVIAVVVTLIFTVMRHA